MEKPCLSVAVVMQRRESRSRWQSEVWEPIGVLPGEAGADGVRQIVDGPGIRQWIHAGYSLVLHRDEAEGYYLNVSTPTPKLFVLWREEDGRAVPLEVTASYNEASRWMDGGHAVDGVPMPPEICAWVVEFVERNYRPEPRKRIKPRSFMHPKDRAAG